MSEIDVGWVTTVACSLSRIATTKDDTLSTLLRRLLLARIHVTIPPNHSPRTTLSSRPLV